MLIDEGPESLIILYITDISVVHNISRKKYNQKQLHYQIKIYLRI